MKNLCIYLLVLSSTIIHAQTCKTEIGINLSINGPYSTLPPRDQGTIGTCYAHAGTDLLSSYLNIGRIDVVGSAIESDNGANGGHAHSVIEAQIAKGWACKDTGQFWNLFPSPNNNIISELQNTMTTDMPIFYTMMATTEKGRARQNRIAQLAAKFAKGEMVPCGPYLKEQRGHSEFERLSEKLGKIEIHLENLEKQKSLQSGKEINEKIKKQKEYKNLVENKATQAYGVYSQNLSTLENGRYNLDAYSESEAAEIVYYWAEKVYPTISKVFNKYGLSQYTPSMNQFIVDRVHYDPKLEYAYAGQMYPYKLVKKYIDQACSGANRMSIAKNIKVEKVMMAKIGQEELQKKLESLIQAKKPQGVGISISSLVLNRTSDINSKHAVNIIGCRTLKNGTLEYLVHNSWGSGCKNYWPQFQTPDKCSGGRVWIPAQSILAKTTEIQWISKK